MKTKNIRDFFDKTRNHLPHQNLFDKFSFNDLILVYDVELETCPGYWIPQHCQASIVDSTNVVTVIRFRETTAGVQRRLERVEAQGFGKDSREVLVTYTPWGGMVVD